jgi:hypothetical protein
MNTIAAGHIYVINRFYKKKEFDMKNTSKITGLALIAAITLALAACPTPPERPTDLAEHTMASRSPHILEFDESDRGKTVYIALQWQNERGLTGPWSEMQTAVVP